MSSRTSFGWKRPRVRSTAVALFTVAVLGTAAVAIARSFTIAVSAVRVAGRSERIAVDSAGVTVYVLSPETARHLLCTQSSGCFSVWPPVKVGAGARLTKARGVQGRVGTIRRDGFTQLTLGGHPLYTFAPDGRRRGVATGNGIQSFGGTWHVIAER